ncbi:uncharacterized protein Dwil_GK15465 [Drosophila willistoni]|uniref:BPTI/Kunitz inhibitor domain-containing protein n=1 Tax=Drosophila willistoni TaxID=7260 RepID=B4MVB7_DROWI|nr:uncharacterized protein LOC6642277 [Drosophila willistoni]EDW76462.2 uncharacterized protein Dwil_GK15465 [Drosophila willistoni]
MPKMSSFSRNAISLMLCLILAIGSLRLQLVEARVRDLCQVKPSTSGLCVPSTLGIYYDEETQHCHFVGCNNKRLFSSLDDCEKICNNSRHIKLRSRSQRQRVNETTN